MFWRMTGLSTASPVETILDKHEFTLEELLDEDEIIQECKALNGRLINFLRERNKVKQLVQYIVEEPPEGAEKQRTFKFPFIACEIFTCEIDIILKTLIEDEELMDLLFSFLEPESPHSTFLAGYFSKVVVCLLLRKTTHLMSYIQAHQDIIKKLVDLIGITSIMEVLIRLIGADEQIYSNCMNSMQWFEDMNVLEIIVEKFSSSDCPEVHANAAEILCAITRHAPPGLALKITSPSFIERLFRHALEDSRPKSVLVNLLSVCISLLDPKRHTSGTYYLYTRELTHGSGTAASPETVRAMLDGLGNLLKLLDISSEDHVLPTSYGKLQPPLGKHRLKIIEFISVLVTVSNEVAEKELIRLGAVKHILELFFEYPYNNLLHYHVEHIVISCLESKKPQFIEHLLHDCNLVGKILEAEKTSTLTADTSKPTISAEGRKPPRIGNIGHLTRIANKLVQLASSNSDIQTFLQDNSDWVDWQTNVLLKRNAVENVFQWACGRPTFLQDRNRDSDDDDYQDRDFDVAALASNLSQAFQYGIYSNDDIEEAHGSMERDDEDIYFDDESAEVVISSLRLGDGQESGSLFTNSNWFAFEGDRNVNEHSTASITSSSPNTEIHDGVEGTDNAVLEEDENLADTAASEPSEQKSDDVNMVVREGETLASDKPPEWVEWRESFDSLEDPPPANTPNVYDATQLPSVPNGELNETVASSAPVDEPADSCKTESGESPDAKDSATIPSQSTDTTVQNQTIEKVADGDSSGESPDAKDSATSPSQSTEKTVRNQTIEKVADDDSSGESPDAKNSATDPSQSTETSVRNQTIEKVADGDSSGFTEHEKANYT